MEFVTRTTELPPDLSAATVSDGSSSGAALGLNRQIGPYLLGDQIGQGGMGAVFKAEQHEPIRRTVAVKIIRGEVGCSNIVARFEAERQALARMDHPNIAKILDAGTQAGLPFFVMELVPGEPITKFCDEQMLDIRQRLQLFLQVCDAIAHAHTKAILHRDIKWSNVLAYRVDGKPVAKVIDFGIAKALGDDSLSDRLAKTQVGRVIGTWESMSPEQVEGIADIDTRTDVYALGVLLYELLCGYKPFAGKMYPGVSEIELQRIIREVDPPSPSTRVSGEIARARHTDEDELTKRLRTELEWIPLKACRKERERRYDSAIQLAQDIRNYLDGRPLIAGPDTKAYRLKKFTRRNKGSIATALAVLLALLLGIIGTTIGMVREARERRAAERANTEASQQRDNAQAMVDFLTSDVIERASPARTFDKNVRDVLVNNLLLPANQSVHARFANKPLIEAAVLDMLALTFKDLDRNDLAIDRAKASYDLRLAALGPDSIDTIGTLGDYAMMLQRAGKTTDAEALFKKALAQSLARVGEDHSVTIQLLNNYARDLMDMGQLGDAEPLYARAVAAGRRVFGNDDRRMLDLINNEANLLLAMNRGSEALPLYKEAWTTARRTQGDDSGSTVEYLDHYAVALAQDGHAAEAEPLLHDAWERSKKSLGENDPATVDALNSYALLLQRVGRSEQALPLAEKAWRIRQAAVGDDAPQTRNSLNNYANVLASLHRLPEATDIFRQIYERDLRLDGPTSASSMTACQIYAEALKTLGRWEEAKPLFEGLWHQDEKSLGPEEPETLSVANRYAITLFNTNHPADAEKIFRMATESAAANKAMGAEDNRTKLFAANLAKCLDRLNRPDEAEKIRGQFKLVMPATAAGR